MNPTLTGLNPPQIEAVDYLNGPLLILAGAGSGKTRVLTHRVAQLISNGFAGPDEILAVTFTNKAAKEMESRIYKILLDMKIQVMDPLWISTFHSFCNRILRQHCELLEYKKGFSIYDDSDQLSLIKKCLTALNINDKNFPAKNFRLRINSAKTLGVTSDQIDKTDLIYLDEKTRNVFKLYEQEMKRANAFDFGDLLLKTYELFRMYPDVLEMYQDQFRYIMVDEYQDTNRIQYLLVSALAKKNRNLCVVGDEDQSIYSWRGADIRNILDFEKDFPEAKVVKLEQNYRSTGNIVKAASEVIRNNKTRRDKVLFTENSDGDKIQIREEKSDYDEGRFVTRQIQELVSSAQCTLQDIAIFYRTNAQSRVLEEQLRQASIPYKIIGGMRFFERLEIKDALSYMRIAQNPNDEMAFKRIFNSPTRGLGKTTLDRLEELSIQQKAPLIEVAKRAVDTREFHSGTTSKLRGFLQILIELNQEASRQNLLDFYQILLEKTGYIAALKKDESPESLSRIENLEELSNAISQFMKERPDPSLMSFLEEMALVSDVDEYENEASTVTLMTLHVSKGLEFPYVFIVGMEENLFPSAMGQDDDPQELEEERRLAYVGMTRARVKLWLTYARSRRQWGQEHFNPPSRFLKEIPNQFVEFSTAMSVPKFLQNSTTFQMTQRNTMRTNDDFEHQSFPEDTGHESTGFAKGARVKHPAFGVGSIFQTEGSGDDQRVTVLFADQTVKKFVVKYARLTRV